MDKTETTNKTAESITYGTKTADSTSKTFNLGGQHSVAGTYGWICPICGRGVAPDQKYCGCRPQLTPIYPSYPVYPYWWYKVTCDTTGTTPDAATTYTTTGMSTKVEV